MDFRKDFENAAKACGVDTLALHPNDMKTDGRYYYEESTEKAYDVAAELSLKAQARIGELEQSLHGIVTGFKNVLESKPVRDADEIIYHIEKLLEIK